jgi:hypothetical protein
VTHTVKPDVSPSRHREAAGRLLEVVGDDHPRQMIIFRADPLPDRLWKQNSAYGSTSGGPPDTRGAVGFVR